MAHVLLTGGAGFIGSNLVAFFLKQPIVESVRVMDNFSTGHMSNLEEFIKNLDKYSGNSSQKDMFLERDKDIFDQ